MEPPQNFCRTPREVLSNLASKRFERTLVKGSSESQSGLYRTSSNLPFQVCPFRTSQECALHSREWGCHSFIFARLRSCRRERCLSLSGAEHHTEALRYTVSIALQWTTLFKGRACPWQDGCGFVCAKSRDRTTHKSPSGREPGPSGAKPHPETAK